MAKKSGRVDGEFLERSWRRAWSGLGAQGSGDELRGELLEAYGESERRYHNVEHLVDCLRLLEATQELARDLGAVEMALWFHDAVYDVRGTDNEEESAVWAVEALGGAGVDKGRVEAVRAMILATVHGAAPVDLDQQLLVDIDLSILGSSAERYERYEEQIREEYSWVPGPLFRAQRAMILGRFLEREWIYQREWFRERFEAAARVNLAQAIEALNRA